MSKKKYKIKWSRFIPVCLLLVALIAVVAIKAPVWFCKHSYENGVCTQCGKECKHEFENGICTKCSYECPHEFEDGTCSICGLHCDHNFENGICTNCGYECPHEFENSHCKLCDFVCTEHNIEDGTCTICGTHEIRLSLLCGGDVMAHKENLKSASNHDGTFEYDGRTAGTNSQNYYTDATFDFNDNYQYIKDIISGVDLAMVNIETTFNSTGTFYSGNWGAFTSPDALAEAVANAGLDVTFTSNNHSADQGYDGIVRTVQVLENNGLTVVGSQENAGEDKSAVIEVKGVKVGLVSYTYETSSYASGYHSINGSNISDKTAAILNSFRYTLTDNGYECSSEDKQAIADQIQWCKDNGANIVICYFHWDNTNEYVFNVTHLQSDLAEFAANAGADVIFGSHPHRVQKAETIVVDNGDGTSRTVPVYYSLGNFISNQRYETMDGDPKDDPYASEQEIMAYLDLGINIETNQVTVYSMSAIPMYVDKFYENGWPEYRIYPLIGDFSSYSELNASGNYWRAEKALSTLTDILGADMIYK